MRRGVVYGPDNPSPVDVRCDTCHESTDDRFQSSAPDGEPPSGHRSVEADFFSSAEFCAACHQMDGGFELNGKVLTNTYNEWKESIYGENNIACQTCHMPDRRHLFRGIHDKEMTRQGLRMETGEATLTGGVVKATLLFTNVGAGHKLPTYVTPQIEVRGTQLDGKGAPIEGTMKETYIGRKVTQDLSTELYDTRIAPEKTLTIDYEWEEGAGAQTLLIEVIVHPDDFYHTFFTNMLDSGFGVKDRAELEEAVKATGESSYILYMEELPLDMKE